MAVWQSKAQKRLEAASTLAGASVHSCLKPTERWTLWALLWTVWTAGGQALSSIESIESIMSMLRRRRLTMLNPGLQAGVASSP